MARRLDWDRSSDGVSGVVIIDGPLARVTQQKLQGGYSWEVIGSAADRITAFERAERALLASLARSVFSPEWIEETLRMAHAGEAYMTVRGVRDMTALFRLARYAVDGASMTEPVAISCAQCGACQRKPREDDE